MGDTGIHRSGCISAQYMFYGLDASACVEKHKSRGLGVVYNMG